MMMKKQVLSGMCALVLLSFLSAQTVHAQERAGSTVLSPFSYDVSQEIEVGGNVATILLVPVQGMIPGSHILLTSPSGSVDVSLGVFGLRGPGSLSVKEGQPVSVHGVMKTLRGKEVVLARTVKVDEKVYAIRNEHGIPVPPQARDHAARQNSQMGETR